MVYACCWTAPTFGHALYTYRCDPDASHATAPATSCHTSRLNRLVGLPSARAKPVPVVGVPVTSSRADRREETAGTLFSTRMMVRTTRFRVESSFWLTRGAQWAASSTNSRPASYAYADGNNKGKG